MQEFEIILIPAYSGKRERVVMDINGNHIYFSKNIFVQFIIENVRILDILIDDKVHQHINQIEKV